jgi:lysophospholipase L1-like esterase
MKKLTPLRCSRRTTGLALVALLAGCATTTPPPIPQVAPTAKALTPEPRKEHKGWGQRQDLLNARAKAGGFDVMFIGDSITHAWESRGKEEWRKKIAPFKAANFGISGDRTEHVLWRLEHGNLAGALNPKVIILMLGTNNTRHNKETPEATAAGLGAICGKLHTRFPAAQILLFAIFPRGAKPTDALRQTNNAVNQIIARYNGHWNIKFLDINAQLLEADGTLSKEMMPDLLHPGAQGYAIWADALVPEIQAALKR